MSYIHNRLHQNNNLGLPIPRHKIHHLEFSLLFLPIQYMVFQLKYIFILQLMHDSHCSDYFRRKLLSPAENDRKLWTTHIPLMRSPKQEGHLNSVKRLPTRCIIYNGNGFFTGSAISVEIHIY